MGILTKAGSPMTALMLHDIEGRSPIDVEHVLSAMRQQAEPAGVDAPFLRLARCRAGTYETRRKREAKAV